MRGAEEEEVRRSFKLLKCAVKKFELCHNHEAQLREWNLQTSGFTSALRQCEPLYDPSNSIFKLQLQQAFYLNLRLPLQLVSLQFNWIGRCQLLYYWLSENWIPDIFCNTCILVSSCPWYSVSSCHHQNHTFYDWNGDEWKVAFLNITWCRVSARDWLKVVLRQKITKKHTIIVKGLKWKMN